MTFLFTTRLKIIVFISVAVIISTLLLLGYELGWRSALSTYKEQEKIINAKPISSLDNQKNTSESKN
tara:strand:+ start:588 stop:788 length:201 start_codon:yes stop_codon:yes gene_type:complete